MGLMVYLIIVTAATVPKIWDPYEILGLSTVNRPQQGFEMATDHR